MAAASRTVVIAVDASDHSKQAFECEYSYGSLSPIDCNAHDLHMGKIHTSYTNVWIYRYANDWVGVVCIKHRLTSRYSR